MRASLRRCTPASKVMYYHDPRYPVTGPLTEVFGGYRSADSERRMPFAKTHDRHPGQRVEVVSEQLCVAENSIDDIIGYLAPSLEAYKGCTLIDVHPGACLWSSKLHAFLKPKRHILMEPEKRYDSFVKPLLEQPGSTYRLTRLVGAHAREYWNNYTELLDDKSLVPDRPALMPDDPKLREIDTSILLTGNLWRKYPIQHKSRYADHTNLLLQHMTYAALTNSIFHRSGLVRMLWWANDEAKLRVFPTNVRSKKSFDLALQMGATLTEVAGVSRVENEKRHNAAESARLPDMDSSVQGRVERRMKADKVKLPPGREMPSPNKAASKKKDVHIQNSVLGTTCTNIEELSTMVEEYGTWLQSIKEELPKVKLAKNSKVPWDGPYVKETLEKHVRYQQSIDGIRSRDHFNGFNSSLSARLRAIIVMDVTLRLINLEANYAAVRDTRPDPNALASALEQILELSKATYDLINIYSSKANGRDSHVLIDDIISCEAQPETLLRDRRPYEPLQAHAHEFWPQYELTLLDCVPNTADLSAPDLADRFEGAKVCQELLKHLFHSPAIPITTALERLAPNAAQDLIPEVPALTDARKGGRLDCNKMTVRMMTPEMMDGIVRAFLEWPFRPSSVEMTLAQSDLAEEGEEGEDVSEVEAE